MVFKTQSLSPKVLSVIRDKGTEAPFKGEYNKEATVGTYLCRQCGLALFRASTQFNSACGWPSFDAEIPEHVRQLPDADGQRIEIVCARCQGHLGHVFKGEQFTAKNTRHCVNACSIDFVKDATVMDTEEAIVAGGCFWGVEYYLQKLPGVLKTEVGYSGGSKENPGYKEVCGGRTGHVESVRVVFDPKKISYTEVIKCFMEIHDPTQQDGQGPDVGAQYLSVIFYYDDAQKKIATLLIEQLKQLGYPIVTQLLPVSVFWVGEEYHQAYYEKTGKAPYCHEYVKRFK